MNTAEKVLELRRITESDDKEDILLSYLDQAGEIILNRMYPYDDLFTEHGHDVPDRFAMKQVRVAAYLLNKRGAEGEVQHIENGIHRNYKNADVPNDLLWDVFPNIGIPR